jgi:hypothetical protein
MISIGVASVLVVSVEVPLLASVAAPAAPTAVPSSPAAIVSSPARSAAFQKEIEAVARKSRFFGIGSAADSDAFISMAGSETVAIGRREEQGCWEWYCLQSELTPRQGAPSQGACRCIRNNMGKDRISRNRTSVRNNWE